MNIIDAHLHFVPGRDYFIQTAARIGADHTAEGLQKAFREAGISHGIVMGNQSLLLSDHEYPGFLSYCIGIERQAYGSWAEALPMIEAHFRRPNCVGAKLYPGYQREAITGEAYGPLFELAAQYGKPVAIHTGATASVNACLKYCHPLLLDELAVEFPKVRFVMCHYGNPFLADAAAVVSKNPNVAADLSGLLVGLVNVDQILAEQGHYVRQLQGWIEYLGPEGRLMFGTDWPLADHRGYIEFLKRIIPERQWEAVFYGNAAEVYGLEGRITGKDEHSIQKTDL